MAVTARKAGWPVSSSFLPADSDRPSAPKASAARARWSALSVFWVPIQVNETRAAAIVARSLWAGVGPSPTSTAVGRASMRSSSAVIVAISLAVKVVLPKLIAELAQIGGTAIVADSAICASSAGCCCSSISTCGATRAQLVDGSGLFTARAEVPVPDPARL